MGATHQPRRDFKSRTVISTSITRHTPGIARHARSIARHDPGHHRSCSEDHASSSGASPAMLGASRFMIGSITHHTQSITLHVPEYQAPCPGHRGSCSRVSSAMLQSMTPHALSYHQPSENQQLTKNRPFSNCARTPTGHPDLSGPRTCMCPGRPVRHQKTNRRSRESRKSNDPDEGVRATLRATPRPI
jgi:hypothetical protein